MTNITDQPCWHRVEAGLYVRPIGLNSTLQIVHLDHMPADKLQLDRWIVRTVSKRNRITALARFHTYRQARAFADEWRARR